MRWRLTIGLAFALCAATLILGDASRLGRLLLTLDQPWLAARLLDKSYWQGVALYREGRFEESAEVFRGEGKAGFFNRGNALAKLGRYEEAVAFYDAVLFYAPDDGDARANRALVDALIEKKDVQTSVQGSVLPEGAPANAAIARRAQGRTSDFGEVPVEQVRVSQVFAGQAMGASREWLATLADEPGRYLKLRIAAEHERRLKLGIGAAGASDPW